VGFLRLTYENDILVGDIKSGNMYIFNLSENRKSLKLNEPFDDKVANKNSFNIINLFSLYQLYLYTRGQFLNQI